MYKTPFCKPGQINHVILIIINSDCGFEFSIANFITVTVLTITSIKIKSLDFQVDVLVLT